MLFNSAIFLVFFLCVYVLYWFVFKKYRLWILLLSGCVFYGWWDWRFLLLLFFTSGIDFLTAKKIHHEERPHVARRWLIVSVTVNLITLGFFKYYNFFAASFVKLLGLFHLHPSFTTVHVILPVGISFYTFQSIAYVTDVYRRRITPEHSALHYFAFICFFPQMVAGPIERAKKLLPQFHQPKMFSRRYFESGINLVLYGFFQKIVIADNLALIVDQIHGQLNNYTASVLILGILAFALQIYADFCGYSNIARGCAQLLGFKLVKNFYFPYFACSLQQFWTRWHISLSSWFRDYVYIPLGGNRAKPARRSFNLLFTFLVSGLWHGANFTFVLWGFFHGLALIIEKSVSKRSFSKLLHGIIVFAIVSVLFTLFRSPNLHHFFEYLAALLTNSGSQGINSAIAAFESRYLFLLPLFAFIVFEILKYNKSGLGQYRYNYLTNALVILFILLFAVFENAPQFIYFQF